jgi:C1A family cysteine protease
MRSALYAGHPICFGFTVHNSFMTQEVANTGIMPLPGLFDGDAGGHCVDAIGWLDNYPAGNDGVTSWYICRNSWGTGWGLNGCFLMPSQLFIDPNTSSDFWIIPEIGFS